MVIDAFSEFIQGFFLQAARENLDLVLAAASSTDTFMFQSLNTSCELQDVVFAVIAVLINVSSSV